MGFRGTEFDITDIPSFNMDRHMWLIYGLVRWLRPESCVEVGAFMGRVSCAIAEALHEEDCGYLTCIDDGSYGQSAEILHNHLAYFGLANRVTFSFGDSADESLWPPSVDFAVIDGNHSLEYVERDFENAAKRGASCIVLHDTTHWWGPREFVEKMRGNREFSFLKVPFDAGLTVFIRNTEDGPLVNTRESNPDGLP